MIRARMFAIACGYEDSDDLDALRFDPAFELALFNAHYDGYCFQPMHIFEAATGKPVLSLLRPGKRPSGRSCSSPSPTLPSFQPGLGGL